MLFNIFSMQWADMVCKLTEIYTLNAFSEQFSFILAQIGSSLPYI